MQPIKNDNGAIVGLVGESGSGMSVKLKEMMENAVDSGEGFVYVDQKFQRHHAIIGRTRDGMSCFEEQVKEITTVLESYDEDVIKEAFEKNNLLDLKNLNEADLKKTIELLMQLSGNQEDGKYANYFNGNETFRKKVITIDSFANAQKSIPKKQPDYRKFEKNKRF